MSKTSSSERRTNKQTDRQTETDRQVKCLFEMIIGPNSDSIGNNKSKNKDLRDKQRHQKWEILLTGKDGITGGQISDCERETEITSSK